MAVWVGAAAVRRCLSVAILCLTSLVLTGSGSPLASELSGDTVKAGFLYNFAQFARWPSDGTPSAPTVYCVETGALDLSVFAGWGDGVPAAGTTRPYGFARSEAETVLAGCDIAFVGKESATEDLEPLLRVARRHNVLLVADTAGFAGRGGHIELYLEGSQYRFRVNLVELERSGVSMSSKVLRLADIVDRVANGAVR